MLYARKNKQYRTLIFVLIVGVFAGVAVSRFPLTSNYVDPVFENLVSHQTGAAADISPQTDTNMQTVASIGDLLPGLEVKAAREPEDTGLQLLLAQTYAELGQRHRAMKLLTALNKKNPANPQVTLVHAAVLMQSAQPEDLRQAYRLLETGAEEFPVIAHRARLYQGEILLQRGDADGALMLWRENLAALPADDGRRALYETRIAEVTNARAMP